MKEVTRESQIAKFAERLRKKEKVNYKITKAVYIPPPDGYAQIRIYHKKAEGKKTPRYLLKCGDCDNKIEIWYDEKALEIGGVHGSTENWKEILLPLLNLKKRESKTNAPKKR